MIRRLIHLSIVVLALSLVSWETPAPLTYRPGEGWSYEPVGGGKWVRGTAREQYEIAKAAFDSKDYSLALKASRRTVKTWPFSDYSPEAQYVLARSYEAKRQDERAFKEYQTLLEKYPNWKNYEEVLERQFEITGRFLAGQWFKLWGVIPFFPSMDKTAEMYEKIIKNGQYSDIAPKAQMNIGAAREKQSEYSKAVKAYEVAADRYQDKPEVASTALFKAGMAYYKQAKTGEYDQSVAGKAIGTFSDFKTLYPTDARVPQTESITTDLHNEQARGNLKIAQFYEKRKRYEGALVYYNEVLQVLRGEPNSPYVEQAKKKIDEILRRKQAAPKQTAQR